jgi:SPP1 family phage portal protein
MQTIAEIIDGLKKGMTLDLNIPDHINFVRYMYQCFESDLHKYQKMYDYYKGNTDAMADYKTITQRSNLKVNTNFFKKFVKEEVSYTVGNPITYESKEQPGLLDELTSTMALWNKNHDSDLMKYMVIFTKVFEIYRYDEEGFKSIISTPLTGYAYQDEYDNVLFYMDVKVEHLDVDVYHIDVYTKKCVYHLDREFNQIEPPTNHRFGIIPVSVGKLTEELTEDSLYKDLKGLQDAYETNLSDLGNEISDFRNAYMLMTDCEFEEEKVVIDEETGEETKIDPILEMKKKGILMVGKDGKIQWLIKQINDTFVQNTLDRYKDDMYQISCHINHNERLQSNLSGITLRSRLIALENKCALQINAHSNIVTNRLKFWCNYINYFKAKNFDWKKIKIIYTANIPQDDLATAQMLSQVPPGVISKRTASSRFGFIVDLDAEQRQIEREYEEEMKREDESLGELYGNKHQHTETNFEE